MIPLALSFDRLQTVAVLYADELGPYPHIPDVETYALGFKDASGYNGPYPVVCHPPCGPWGKLRHLSKKDDPNLALLAVAQVRIFGGVLEHPAHSRLWSTLALPLPGDPADEHGGYTIAVNQCDWGHVARKATWLYCVRVPRDALVTPAPREPTHWITGFTGAAGVARNAKYKNHGSAVPVGIKLCSAQQRRRTPVAFAEYLVSLARACVR